MYGHRLYVIFSPQAGINLIHKEHFLVGILAYVMMPRQYNRQLENTFMDKTNSGPGIAKT